jgi:hypothetical protein
VRVDAVPSYCDAVGCEEPATESYFHAHDARLVEFGVCSGHHSRLRKGAQPVVAGPRSDPLGGQSHPTLVIE